LAGSLQNKLMKILFLLSVLICIMLSACSGQESTLTALPPATFLPSSTATLTRTPQPTLTATVTPLPAYNTKQVIFNYYVNGILSQSNVFFERNSFRSYSKIVLYEDGQLIITGKTYRQIVLSQSEVKQFLSKIESLGFYSLESNQAHDQTDKLYNFESDYRRGYDALLYCVLVNAEKSRELCVEETGIPFLTPKMGNILKFLNEYQPTGMTTYYPDRIVLWVERGRKLSDDQLVVDPIVWKEQFPSIETSDQKFMYLDGDVAKDISMLFDNIYAGKVVSQNGIEYTVHVDIILPHEKVTNSYQ
jgi:hypothetical protein